MIAYKVIGSMNADTLDSVNKPKIAKAMKERMDFHRTPEERPLH